MENEKEVIITLDNDKKYVLIDKITYQNEEYLYLTNVDNVLENMIVLLKDNKAEKVLDKEKIQILVKLFEEKIKKDIQ